MNYFEFYEMEPSFNVDLSALKDKFYANSKKYHPDFYTMESPMVQAEVMQKAVLNNKAYKTLADFESRLKYILELEGQLGEEGENKLPQQFLMEMMDLNEKIMELQFDFDHQIFQNCQSELKEMEASNLESIQKDLSNYTYGSNEKESLERIKFFYLKNRYLLRIKETLAKFANA